MDRGMVLADNLMQSEISSESLVVTAVEELGGYGYVVMSTAIARKKKQVQELLDWVTENRQQPT